MSKGDPNLPGAADPNGSLSADSLPVAIPADVSRRSFLKQTGGAASAAALLSLPTPGAAAPGGTAAPAGPALVLGPGAVPVTLLVNGKAQKLMIEPSETLATVLRDRLGLTGTKVGCDRGGCGACTIHVAGSPQLACMTLALDVAGMAGKDALAITTVEGLAKGAQLHPLQQAFIEKDALQCGYCTSGMLMSCAALYEQAKAEGKLATISDGDVRAAIAGNLCRCGAYPHIVDATLSAAKGAAK